MSKTRKATVSVKGTDITVFIHREEDYISLTDIARNRNPEHTDDLIRNWLRNRNTIEFLGIWESLNNPELNPVEFDGFKIRAGLGAFSIKSGQRKNQACSAGVSPAPASETSAFRQAGRLRYLDLA